MMTRCMRSMCPVGLVLLLSGCSGFVAGTASTYQTPQPRPIARTEKADLRVMSFNIRINTVFDLRAASWDTRKELLVRTIRNFEPDLLGTQECGEEQGQYLSQNLSGYEFVGVSRYNSRFHIEMCGVFFKSERFRKLEEGHFWLSETPEKPGSMSWGAGYPRMVTWVKLRPTEPGGSDLYFFNTHLDSESSRARVEAARLLQRQIARIAGGQPVVMTGDFNTGEGTPPYRVLTASAGGSSRLVDTLRAVDPGREPDEGTRHEFRGDRRGQRMDWILATDHFAAFDAAIDYTRDGDLFPSDHFPVTAVLRLKPRSAAAGRPQTGG